MAPSLAAYDGQLCIAWTAGDHHLDVMCSSDGIHFPASAFKTSQTSLTAPAMTVEQSATPGQPSCLVLAWMGTNGRINYMSTTTGMTGFSEVVTLPQFGENGVAVGSPAPGMIDFGWTGLDGFHRLNFLEMSA
jgi:hypothetical protein